MLETIKQGESLDFKFDLGGETTSEWVCTLNLKRYPDDKTLINRIVTATDDTWSGFLTATETKNLDVAQYMLIAKLVNATTNEKDHKIKRFYVTKKWA